MNCYLLVEGRDALLVDTASAPGRAGEHVDALLGAAGVRPQELTGIVLTHCHHDHAGGITDLQQRSGAPVLMHRLEMLTISEAAQLAESQTGLSAWLALNGAPTILAVEMAGSLRWRAPEHIDSPRLLEGGEELPVGERRWRVLQTAGHSPGHLCLYEPGLGLLITGDHVLPNESSNISVRPDQPHDPLGSYLEALHRVRDLQPRLSLPGHGEPFTNLVELVDGQLHHHEVRLQDARLALRRGPRSGFEVATEIPWVQRSKSFFELEPRHRFLAFGEALAHLERLEAAGQAGRLPGSPVRWTLAGAGF